MWCITISLCCLHISIFLWSLLLDNGYLIVEVLDYSVFPRFFLVVGTLLNLIWKSGRVAKTKHPKKNCNMLFILHRLQILLQVSSRMIARLHVCLSRLFLFIDENIGSQVSVAL